MAHDVRVAARLTRIDSSAETHVAVCACGCRVIDITASGAAAALDLHRAAYHPTAAAATRSNRRKRAG